MMASEKGHLGVVQALLDAGANKEAADGVGGGWGSWKCDDRGRRGP